MTKKKLGFFSIGMMNVVIVASLQMMMPCAVYGYSLLFFYLIATLVFFIPSLLMIAELTTSYPVTGGSYIWVEKAFGKSWGFFAVCIQWLCNLIWYPTIFSFIATVFAYLICPELATHKLYLFCSMLILFWGITLLNCFGIKISSLASTFSALVGIILPTLILVLLGITWLIQSNPSQIQIHSLIPDFKDTSKLAFLTQIIISLIGLEMAFVHAGDIHNPRRSIPKALFFSAIIILFIVIAAPLSIATVIPSTQIDVIAGLLDAFQAFFSHFHVPKAVSMLMLLLIFIGNCGTVTGWMISSTRGMQVACKECAMPRSLQKTNRYLAPVGILVLEAIIFSGCAVFFLFFDTISNAYWILLTLACQIALLYYLLIFAAAVKLKKEMKKKAFAIPGGVCGTLIAAGLAGIAVISTITLGFFPPAQGTTFIQGSAYPLLLGSGIGVVLIIPMALLTLRKSPKKGV